MARRPESAAHAPANPRWWTWPNRIRHEDRERYALLPEHLRLESRFCARPENWRNPDAEGWDAELERAHASRRWQASVVGWLHREGHLTDSEVDIVAAVRPRDLERLAGSTAEAEVLVDILQNGPPSPAFDPAQPPTRKRKRK